MKIAHLEAALYRIPPTVPWEDATHRVGTLEFVITQIHTDTEITGWGFAYTTGVGGSAILALLDHYCPGFLLGRDPLAIESIWNDLGRQLHRCGTGGINTLAQGAIDIALWDIAGKARGVPVHRLLGGERASIPAYGSGIDLFMEQDALIFHVDELLELGFDAIKIKIGRDDPLEDVERTLAVRQAIGAHRQLIVDANQRWTAAEAISRLLQLHDAGLAWVEEPLNAEDIAGHADLRQRTNFPLAVGESLYTDHQFVEYLRGNAVDIVQADICRVGGITPWLRIAHLAGAFHRSMAPHFLAELSVGVLCAIDNASILEWVRGGSFSEMGVLAEPLRLNGGHAFPFETPGHGLQFVLSALEPYRVDPASLRGQDLRSAK